MCEYGHKPVLLEEVLSFLRPSKDGLFVDCTCGPGGHAEGLLRKGARVLGIDLDGEALTVAENRLREFIPDRLTLVQGNFKEMARLLDEQSMGKINGLLVDFGVSSLQMDSPSRGFSFRKEAFLDMRMDPGSDTTVADLIARTDEKALTQILEDFGQERFARRIARSIVYHREKGPIETTGQLTNCILRSLPRKSRGRKRIHPSTRSFQALRIAVNRELEALDVFFASAPNRLAVGGRMCAISYHSLEDRIVKQTFRSLSGKGRENDSDFTVLTRKPIRPSREEVKTNPRSRSAKLRVLERSEG